MRIAIGPTSVRLQVSVTSLTVGLHDSQPLVYYKEGFFVVNRSRTILKRLAQQRKLCACGRTIFGIGRQCRACREQRQALRAEVPRKTADPVRGPDENRHPEHLEWIRGRLCAIKFCPGKSQAAHVRLNTGGGMGLKPDDRWAIPLCQEHHLEQHRIGHQAFDAKYGIDSRTLAERYAAQSPYLEKAGTK